MSWIDWMIVVIPLAIVVMVEFRTQKHVANITTVWFVYGGIHDLRELFRNLKTYKSDAKDDGTVALTEEQVLPDNYINFVEIEYENEEQPKPYRGKPSKID